MSPNWKTGSPQAYQPGFRFATIYSEVKSARPVAIWWFALVLQKMETWYSTTQEPLFTSARRFRGKTLSPPGLIQKTRCIWFIPSSSKFQKIALLIGIQAFHGKELNWINPS